SPGGSSSGSATGVAARMVTTAVGTQTGGSITVPASSQGLTGLKPTMGRVSLRGVIPLTYTRDHPGPIARDARDAALMLQVMAGPDPADPRTLGLPPVPDYLTAATPVPGPAHGDGPPGATIRWPTRLGIPPGWADVDGPAGERRRRFLASMEEGGVTVVDVPPPTGWAELSSGIFNAGRLPERSEPFLPWLRQDVRLFGVTLSSWIQGLLLSGDEYVKAQRGRLALLRLALDSVFHQCDAVVQGNHVPFDMIGLPLVTFPIGFREAGEGGGGFGGALPEGILVGAPPFGEERLLSLAALWQARSGHHLRRPSDPAAGDSGRPPASGARGRLELEEVASLSQ
ncbi:MAG: amidase, partial [Gemmatimonadales bacterium]